MKSLFHESGLPMCKYLWFLRRDWERDPLKVVSRIESALGYPCFAKPANLGSSVGISRATDADSLRSAIELAAQYDRRIIIEEGLTMSEIECAILGNDDPEASLPGEYVITASFGSRSSFRRGHAVLPAPAVIAAGQARALLLMTGLFVMQRLARASRKDRP